MVRRASAERLAVALLLTVGVVLPTIAQAADSPYTSTIVRGKLQDSRSGEPLRNAQVRLVSTAEEDAESYEATSDEEGKFELVGVPYGSYAVEIVTELGLEIHGLNSITVDEKKQAVDMTVSSRTRSTTALRNEPELFVASIEKQGVNWKKFWRQFAIFIGAAAAGGAAAL